MNEDEAASAAAAEETPQGSEEVPQGSGEVPQGSVFGNLPDSRPGVRSPRRDRARSAGGDDRAADPEPEPAAASRASGDDPYEAPGPEPSAEESPEPRGPGGLEDVAWAGVAAAAEAATIGVRIANRAFEALRDAVDRR